MGWWSNFQKGNIEIFFNCYLGVGVDSKLGIELLLNNRKWNFFLSKRYLKKTYSEEKNETFMEAFQGVISSMFKLRSS